MEGTDLKGMYSETMQKLEMTSTDLKGCSCERPLNVDAENS